MTQAIVAKPLHSELQRLRFKVWSIRGAERLEADRLRVQAYAKAPYFSLADSEALHTDQDPADSVVLGLWSDDVLAGTVRWSMAGTEEEAQALLGVSAPIAPELLPAVVPARGAVDPRFRGQGIMPYLVTLALVDAKHRANAGRALAMQAQGTPHQGAMVQAGWQVRETSAYKSQALSFNAPSQLLFLEASRFEAALAAGLAQAGNLVQRTKVVL